MHWSDMSIASETKLQVYTLEDKDKKRDATPRASTQSINRLGRRRRIYPPDCVHTNPNDSRLLALLEGRSILIPTRRLEVHTLPRVTDGVIIRSHFWTSKIGLGEG